MAQVLGPTDLENIKAQLRQLDEADSEIKRAKMAGIDMTVQEQQSKEARQQLLRIRQTYFPGQ
jgi:hypothetical protein